MALSKLLKLAMKGSTKAKKVPKKALDVPPGIKEKLDKELQAFQNNGGFYGPSKILDGLADAENEAYNYQHEIEQGRWDGEIEVDS